MKKEKNTNYRTYSISKKPGQLWRATCYDSYGEYSENYFETEERANEWVYWRWENEDLFYNSDKNDLLGKAIKQMIEIDKERGVEPSLD
tara:strand:+ start:273 stop:539 length:267 start_codon:yes stop_codon:yes gene_type:complete